MLLFVCVYSHLLDTHMYIVKLRIALNNITLKTKFSNKITAALSTVNQHPKY